MSRRALDKASYYRGVRMAPYDLVKELSVASIGILVVVLVLSALLSSPDVAPLTVQQWAKSDPVDFVTTATSELASASTSSQYGPPYNNGSGSLQSWGPLQPQSWGSVHQPVDAPQAFVLQPLEQAGANSASVTQALEEFSSAGSAQQGTWLDAFTKALGKATVQDGDVSVPSGDYGPLPTMMATLLLIARTGGLDGLLLSSDRFFQTDYTRPLLFMGDGGNLSGLAQDQKLTGSQWGMMNETGRYPGQAWLWLYTMWYQIPPFTSDSGFLGISAANADLAVVVIMLVLTVLLMFTPFIPGLRDIPRWIPIHRLIWRRYWAEEGGGR